MPFTINDFQDLVRLLEKHHPWRAELRRLILTEELLNLPQLVRELVEAQKRTEQRVEHLAEVVGELVEAQKCTERRIDRAETRLSNLEGIALEDRCLERAPAYFSGIIRRIRIVSHERLGLLLDDALEQGKLTPQERSDLLKADVILQGKRNGEECYLLAEVSVTVDKGDVERAARRAKVLQKVVGVPVIAVAAGQRALEDADREARIYHVWCVLDGQTHPPEDERQRD